MSKASIGVSWETHHWTQSWCSNQKSKRQDWLIAFFVRWARGFHRTGAPWKGNSKNVGETCRFRLSFHFLTNFYRFSTTSSSRGKGPFLGRDRVLSSTSGNSSFQAARFTLEELELDRAHQTSQSDYCSLWNDWIRKSVGWLTCVSIHRSSSAGSRAISNLGPKIVQDDFAPGCMIKHFVENPNWCKSGNASRFSRNQLWS